MKSLLSLSTLCLLAAAHLPARADSYSALTSAVACNAYSASDARPTRSFGAHNYAAKSASVTCPLEAPVFGMVYGLMAHGGSASFGERVNCVLISLRKQDGAFIALKVFSVTTTTSGMQGTWVPLTPSERSYDAVLEVQCSLPASNRAWLTAFETFAL